MSTLFFHSSQAGPAASFIQDLWPFGHQHKMTTPKFTLNLPTKAKRTAVRGLPPLDLVQVNLAKSTEPRVYEVQRKSTTQLSS
jgi:hypothetical protein